jgi:hypothetical protein
MQQDHAVAEAQRLVHAVHVHPGDASRPARLDGAVDVCLPPHPLSIKALVIKRSVSKTFPSK